MRRIVVPLAIAGLMAVLTAGVVLALNYEGEDFCQDSPAWPNGTYLGQMHPYHSDFYRGFAERRGWDPCVTWATDQRNSAIRGLRELGYTVTAPGELPIAGNVITLVGKGTATRSVTLTEGHWAVIYQVADNQDDSGSAANFIVKVEAVGGGSELIADATSRWVGGNTSLRVGSGILELSPGEAVVSVDAGSQGRWALLLTKQ
ncbi:MAG: hypothetical protein OXG79_02030 [Chloroflexi bacterium]|nr:hypothetical protein [Chloroflexota bacterium]